LLPADGADILEASATDTPVTESGTYALLPSMTLTPGRGDYLLVFSTSAFADSNNDRGDFAVFVGGTEVAHTERSIQAEPALIYSSNSDENLRFHLTDPQGQCVIGSTDDCMINENTKGNRGGLTSIMYGDQVLRVKYSGADNALERFSITSIDPITGQWTVSVETEDGFIQQAHATEDISVKVKYRYHSETITAFSQ